MECPWIGETVKRGLLGGDYLARRNRQILFSPDVLETVDRPFTLFSY